MSNEITAYFKGRKGVAESVYQYDYGMVLVFDGIELPENFDCYFSNEGSEESIPVLGSDNRAAIPNECLSVPGNITVHVHAHTGLNDSEVEYVVSFKVINRARPVDDGTESEHNALSEAVAALNHNNLPGLIPDIVTDWLDDHPEATTTVQDGAITEAKFSNDLKAKAIKDYVTPSMFGAVCDGETDDSAAVQSALSYARNNGLYVAIDKSLLIDGTVYLQSNDRIVGMPTTEFMPIIYVGANCDLAFNCQTIVNRLENFIIRNYVEEYNREVTGIQLNGNGSYDVDSVIKNVSFGYLDIGIEAKGRNCKIEDCHFGHCRVGVYFNIPSDAIYCRGLEVKGCRFHCMGEEELIPWYENSACIEIYENNMGDLIIEDCLADLCGTFFKGYASNALITGNYLQCFEKAIIDINPNEDDIGGYPTTFGSVQITDNYIFGKQGAVRTDVTMKYPSHLISVKKFGRVIISCNTFKNCIDEAISLDEGNQISIIDNAFIHIGSGGTNNAALELTNSQGIFFSGNASLHSGIQICKVRDSDSNLAVKNNYNFVVIDSGNYKLDRKPTEVCSPIGTGAGTSALTFALPPKFCVQDSGNNIYRFEQLGTGGYNQAVAVYSSGSKIRVMYFTKASGATYHTVNLREYTISNGSITVAASAAGLTFYAVD